MKKFISVLISAILMCSVATICVNAQQINKAEEDVLASENIVEQAKTSLSQNVTENLPETTMSENTTADFSTIELNKSSLKIGIGESLQLLTNYAGDETLVWTSSDDNVVSVADNGIITAKSLGDAIITVSSTYLSANCLVSVKNAPKTVSLSKTSITLGVGESVVIKESTNSGSYANADNLVWSSSNDSVASIAKDKANEAVITAKSVGTTSVKIMLYNGITADCKVVVKPAPISVSLSQSSLKMGMVESIVISESTNSGSYANAENLKWSTSDSNVATVTKDDKNKAVIKAVGEGIATITISLYNDVTAVCKLTVMQEPKSVAINTTSVTLGLGESLKIYESTNSGSYANAENLKWSTSNNKVAAVTKDKYNEATVKAVSLGTANITIKLYNGKSAACKVTVKPAPKKVTMSKNSITLGVGESYMITESTNSGTYANSYNLKWSSSNSKVVTVTKNSSNKATIKAVGVGSAKVTITLYNGIKAECNVTVKKAPDKIFLNRTELALRVGETFDLNSSLPKDTAAYDVRYSSSNPSVVSATAAGGIVTAKALGKATVTAVAFNGKKVTCTVIVMPNSKKISNVPLVNQYNLPTGCETCSAAMMLKFYGYSISETKFADKYLVKKDLTAKNGILYGPDPNSAFIGSPYYSSGFGVYAPAMTKFMNNYFADNKSKHKAVLLEGKSLDWLCAEYINDGKPVMVWATINMLGSYKTSSWKVNYADENAKYSVGSTYTWTANEHCLVLTGYDNDYYYFNDPWTNARTKYSRSLVNTRYAELGKQAIAVVEK